MVPPNTRLGNPIANQVVGIQLSGCLDCVDKQVRLINYFKNVL
jgi:hypothetical protein